MIFSKFIHLIFLAKTQDTLIQEYAKYLDLFYNVDLRGGRSLKVSGRSKRPLSVLQSYRPHSFLVISV